MIVDFAVVMFLTRAENNIKLRKELEKQAAAKKNDEISARDKGTASASASASASTSKNKNINAKKKNAKGWDQKTYVQLEYDKVGQQTGEESYNLPVFE